MPQINIGDVSPRNQLTANANGQVSFIYNFPILDAGDLAVYHRTASATPNDATDILNYGAGAYTVTGVGVAGGGTVELSGPVAATVLAGDIITIVRREPFARVSQYSTGGTLTANKLDTDFENQILMAQQSKCDIDKRIPAYPNSAVIFSKDLQLPVLGANEIWMKNTDNTAITTVSIPLFPVGSVTSTGGTANHISRWDSGNIIQDSTAVLDDLGNLSGVTWAGTAISVATGGTGSTTAAGARTSLGLAIGTNVQAFNAGLASIAGLTTAADNMIYTTALDTYATTALTGFARSILDDVDAAAVRATIGLGTAAVQNVGAFAQVANNLSDLPSPLSARTNLGLLIGTNVQAYSSILDSVAAGTYAGDDSIVTVGTITAGVWTGTTIAIANGGSGQTTKTAAFDALSPNTTKGDITVNNGTNNVRLPVGTDGYTIVADSTQDGGIKWAVAAAGTVTNVGGTTDRITSSGGTTPNIDIAATYVGQTSITTLGTITTGTWNGTDIALAGGGTGASLTAPAGDRIFFYDQSASSTAFLDLGTNLSITGTTLNSAGGGGSGDSVTKSVAQVAHGLAAGDVVKFTSSYAKAQANSEANAEVVGYVTAAADADNFTLLREGYVSTGLSGLTAGTTYFLSDTSAGALTATPPTTPGYVRIPLLVALSATTGWFGIQRGVVVSDAASAGTAGEAKSWVRFDATSGTPSINSSLNVASITDNGTGDFTINFTIAFANANYSFAAMGNGVDSANRGFSLVNIYSLSGVTSSSCRIFCSNSSNALGTDNPVVGVLFFGA